MSFSSAYLQIKDYRGEMDIKGDGVKLYYKPIADAFLQLSPDGHSDFFSHIYEEMQKGHPVGGNYYELIKGMISRMHPEAKALIADLATELLNYENN